MKINESSTTKGTCCLPTYIYHNKRASNLNQRINEESILTTFAIISRHSNKKVGVIGLKPTIISNREKAFFSDAHLIKSDYKFWALFKRLGERYKPFCGFALLPDFTG